MIYVQGQGYAVTGADVRLYIINLNDGTPVQNQHGTFTTTLGTLNIYTFETDQYGMAQCQIESGADAGMAVIVAMPDNGLWPTSIDVPILNRDELPLNIDSNQGYQLFIQGKQYKFAAGDYAKSYTMAPQKSSLLLPKIASEITGPYVIHVYRRGVLDYSGRILKIKKTIDNKHLLTGISNHALLGRRVVTRTFDTVSPEYLIGKLLFDYSTGITSGHLDTSGMSISGKFKFDPLSKALEQILAQTGWCMRLNVDETLDFGDPSGSNFTHEPMVYFTTGQDNIDVEDEVDFSQHVTQSYLIGQPNTLVSTKIDAAAAAAYGIMEAVHSASQLKSQSALNLANQVYLDIYKEPVERITAQSIDEKIAAAGGFEPWDFITVNDGKTGIAGLRRVTDLSRDMVEKGVVKIGFMTEKKDPTVAFAQIISELGFKNLSAVGDVDINTVTQMWEQQFSWGTGGNPYNPIIFTYIFDSINGKALISDNSNFISEVLDIEKATLTYLHNSWAPVVGAGNGQTISNRYNIVRWTGGSLDGDWQLIKSDGGVIHDFGILSNYHHGYIDPWGRYILFLGYGDDFDHVRMMAYKTS